MNIKYKLYIMVFIMLCSVLISETAFASGIWCTGKVTNAYIDSDKNVILKGSWRNEYTRICSTDGSNGVDTITCSLWFSIITTSMVHDKEVILMYSDQNSTLNCSNIPTYSSSPRPDYVMLTK